MHQYSHLYEFLKEKREKNECKYQNFPNMGKKRVSVVQEVQSLRQDKPKEEHAKTHSNQTDKYLRQRKTLTATRVKQQTTYRVTPIRLSSDFSVEIQQARREWHDISKVMKGKDLQPGIPCPRRLSFSCNREIKSFTENSLPPDQICNKS